MNCPKCGAEMLPGEMVQPRGEMCYWAPKGMLDQYAFPYGLRTMRKTMENGGMRVKIRNRVLSKPTVAYACKACSLVLIDCNE